MINHEPISAPLPDASKSGGLGKYLQGIQHVGVTVNDMAKSIEFYCEVLGGKLAIAGNGFTGPILQNTLFQKEELDALEQGVDPRSLGVPQIADGTVDALDVRFISFGNTCLELLHFRDAKLTPQAPDSFPAVASGVGWVNADHISFYVKDDVDLNAFAKHLEDESRARGIDKVVCNTIINVKSEAERRQVALKYRANKFWNDPEYFVEGYSDADFGDFLGWSLFYAKGPNGEQLEFNQVTRKAKEHFTRAREEYNAANGTAFEGPKSTLTAEELK